MKTASSVALDGLPPSVHARDALWLERFHAGDRRLLTQLYYEHHAAVTFAVGRILPSVDRETVVHDVFLRLLSDVDFRRSFGGGAIGAWLRVVARNQAIDYARHQAYELPCGMVPERPQGDAQLEIEDGQHADVDAAALIRQFERDVLPAKWRAVFKLRFLEQLDQSEASRRLNMNRTTLIYQEHRIRRLLTRFVLKGR
ncbi:MAG: sigma-70 family RNA polymerase sigma factor [Deltaproteobacteria bacterium]|nr:sigma-70 family RNA polymerase sigma factor [Deltaproteobacteria bacterium]